ncbi:hypothetical protein BDP27DRAFT_647396 [Rhodocollybia butyracea]|uniref:Uncharacterized protein n=1 Tax=Rhodocollybia butyracea TaxID=206335 RepID=A0A9P5PVN6_9AGAR|nr:hypothetical protein BDP27DRAFT_647396 [Rhodocollybia butyracea]
MLKIRWKSRKKSTSSDVGAAPTPNTNPLKLAVRKLVRANTLVSESDAKPTAPTTIDLDSDPDSTPSPPVHLSLSNTHVPAAHQNKLEHTLGEIVPPSMLLAMNTGHIDPLDKHRRQSHDSSSFTSQRRSSMALSLLSLGSLMRVPRPLSPHAGDTFDTTELGYEEDMCWVDNEYALTNESAPTTPNISPIIFSVRPPSPAPPPRPKLVINPGSSVVHLPGMIAVSPESSEVDSQYTNEDDNTQSEFLTPATSPNDSGVPDTPLSCTGMCDSGSPISPIVFSEQAVETLSSLVPRLDVEPLGHETEISSSQMATSNPQRAAKTLSSISARSLSISPIGDPSSPTADLTNSPRKELPRGWTGEWNRIDMQDVIRSLREL